MQRLLVILACLSSTAFADSNLDKARAWIDTTLANQYYTAIKGQTVQGQPCSLNLFHNGYDVIVGMDNDISNNVTVQVDTRATVGVYGGLTMLQGQFAGQSNTVAIQFDDAGSVTRVIGTGGNRDIDCRMK